jgi:regulator of sirC expression with transglutaminase-like and TPR domain
MIPREHFVSMIADENLSHRLGEAALTIASEHYRELDVKKCLSLFDSLAEEAPHIDSSAPDREVAKNLSRYLFMTCRFKGNRDEYYDPRNSFLNEVLERRTGIPISLAIVMMEVGTRMGLDLSGVGFPGHFLVRLSRQGEVILDPFTGQILSVDECLERLPPALRRDEELRARCFAEASGREILSRMLRNLKHIFFEEEKWSDALRVSERLLLLNPDEPIELRDRGVVYRNLECFRSAETDFERFLRLAPEDRSAPSIRIQLKSVQHQLASFH